LLLLLLLVVLLAMLLAISSPAKAGGISRRLINIISQHASWQSPEERIQDNQRVFNHKLEPRMQEFKQTLKNQISLRTKTQTCKIIRHLIFISHACRSLRAVFTSLRTKWSSVYCRKQGTSACGQLPAAENTRNTWKILNFDC